MITMRSNSIKNSTRAVIPDDVKTSKVCLGDGANRTASQTNLPACVKNVYNALDGHGRERGSLVIDALASDGHPFLFNLNLLNLAKGQYDDLATFAIKAGLHEYLCSTKRLHELGCTLLQSIENPIYLANRDGVHVIEIKGVKQYFYVHRGVPYPFGETLALKIGVALEHDILPQASEDLNAWNEHIGMHLKGNPYLLTVTLAAMSAPLHRVHSLPGLILILVGQSTTGKTTAQQVAKSLYEPATSIDNCSGTSNGIRTYLEQFADRPAFLDELHMAEDPDGLIKLIFQVGNAASRKTSTPNQKSSSTQASTCALIAASEKTLDEIVASRRISLTEGISARCIEVIINGENGVFHKTPDGMSSKQFAEHLKAMCEIYYGSFSNEWICRITKNHKAISKRLAVNLEKAEEALCEGLKITDRVTLRMVRGLAVWVCTGLIAINLKLLELSSQEVINAIRLVLCEHLARQKHSMSPIAEKVINLVRDLLDRNATRFPSIAMFHGGTQSGILGFTKGVGAEKVYLFLPSVFEELIGAQFGAQMAAQKLLDAKYLSVGADGLQLQVRLPPSTDYPKGSRKRFYAIKASIRFDESFDPT